MRSSSSTDATLGKLGLYLRELRAPFFTGSLVPVILGTCLAYRLTRTCDGWLFALALVGVVLIHAGANVANDYFDHRSGNDEANTDFVRPFTGGSRMIQRGLLAPREVLGLALVCFALALPVAAYLAFRAGPFVLLLGAIGVLGGFFYTAPPLNLAAHGWGEAVVAVNFGILPAVGAYFLQTGAVSVAAVAVSLPVALLIAAVLFVNQFQDARADAAVGKRNWVVRLGRRRSVTVYALLVTVWSVPIVAGVGCAMLPTLSLVALLPLPIALRAIAVARRHVDEPQRLAPANGLTILLHLSVGLLLAGSLLVR